MARIVSELIYKLIADETELVKGLQKAEKSTDALAKKFTDSGKKLTLGLTVPIVAAGAAMIKLASDTNESLNAANVVFKESTGIIEEWGKTAAENAGLTAAEFNQAAAVMGAQLINTGSATEEAANQTVLLTQRAADMASIFNTSVSDALSAIQAQIRGESEPIRRYAISIDEAAVNAKALALGLVDASGEVTNYGKAQARVALILEQSEKFQGDFKNTSNQLANSTRITTALIKEEAAELGAQLLPIVLEVVKGIRGLVSQFSELSDDQKRLILTFAGITASIGPMLIGIGNAIKAFNTLKIVIAGMASPIGALAIGITGISAILASTVVNIKAAQDEYAKLQKVLEGGTTGSISEDLKIVNKELETVKAQLFASTGFSEKETQELEKQIEQLNIVKASLADKARSQGLNARAQAEIAKAAAEEAKQELQTEESQKRRVEIIERYKRNRQLVVDILNSEKTEYEKIQEQIDILQNSPWASGQNEKDRLAALEVLRAKQIEVVEAERLEEQARSEETKADLISRKEQYINALKEMSTAELESYALTTNEANRASIEKILAQRSIDEEDAKNKAAQKRREEEIQAIQAIGIKSVLSGFADIGAELQRGDLEWRDWGKVGLNAISAVLQALGETMAAQAAVSLGLGFFNPSAWAAIAPLIAGSAAAFTASGVVSSLAGGLQDGGQFIVPPGFNGDTFPMPAAMLSSGERVTVETPEQQISNRGITLQVGVLVADESGLRELDSRLRDIGSFETARRG